METFIQHPKYKRLIIGTNGTVISNVNWIQLTTHISNKGYEILNYRIGSRTNNTRKINGLRVHRLVASIFVENKHNKKTVNHKDGNKLNQNYKNLEWVTQGENNIHAIKTGLRVMPSGKDHWRNKL